MFYWTQNRGNDAWECFNLPGHFVAIYDFKEGACLVVYDTEWSDEDDLHPIHQIPLGLDHEFCIPATGSKMLQAADAKLKELGYEGTV